MALNKHKMAPLTKSKKLAIGLGVGIPLAVGGLAVGLYFALKPTTVPLDQLYGCSGDDKGTCVLMDSKSGGKWKTKEECLCFKCALASDNQTKILAPVSPKGAVGDACSTTTIQNCTFKCA